MRIKEQERLRRFTRISYTDLDKSVNEIRVDLWPAFA